MSASLTFAHSARFALPVSLLSWLVLGRERLHDAHAVDVLVDDGGDVGEARLDQPRHREHLLPHACTPAMKTNGIVDIATNASGTLIVSISHEREDDDAALHEDDRRHATGTSAPARMSELAREMS